MKYEGGDLVAVRYMGITAGAGVPRGTGIKPRLR